MKNIPSRLFLGSFFLATSGICILIIERIMSLFNNIALMLIACVLLSFIIAYFYAWGLEALVDWLNKKNNKGEQHGEEK